MNKVKKASVYFLIFLLVIQYFPIIGSAEMNEAVSAKQAETDTYVVFADEVGGEVNLLDNGKSEVIAKIPDDTEVLVQSVEEEYTEISFTPKDAEEILVGFVHSDSLVKLSLAEEFRIGRDEAAEVDPSSNTPGESANEVIDEEEDKSAQPISEDAAKTELEVADEEAKELGDQINSEKNQVMENPRNQEETENSSLEEEQEGSLLETAKKSFVSVQSLSKTEIDKTSNQEPNGSAAELSIKQTIDEKATSRLGHIRSSTSKIYNSLTLDSSITAGQSYTNKVYYIKKQATVNGQLYYLISNNPSSTNGVVGWVKHSDLSTHTHTGVDKKSKTFFLKGSGKAYSKAWGGSKDVVYSSLSPYRYNQFDVHLTEKVGSNTWYRGTLNGRTVWIHSSYVTTKEESSTSRLGQFKSGSVLIYKNLHDLNTGVSAGSIHTDKVYYIKKQAILSGSTYYLLSSKPSSLNGVIGWVNASGLKTYTHTGVDKQAKTFYLKGTGSAYSKAWGGPKDEVYSSLSPYRYNKFDVHLTEKVGSNTWYRGILNGKTVWIHSSYVTTKEESSTSRLGQFKSGSVLIYKNLHDLNTGVSAGSIYTDKVYYIKKQAILSGNTYYLISSQPSSVNGVVGWVNASGLKTYTHTGVDKQAKSFYIQGSGKAFSKAWGGSKDAVYNLNQYKDMLFSVHLTEKVGSNIWYRGNLNGKTVWIHESYLYTNKQTHYELSLTDALAIQMKAAPQTDKEYKTYVSKEFIDREQKVTADTLNVRGGPSTSSWVVGKLTKGTKVTILGEENGWYQIKYTEYYQWVNASPIDVMYYLDPKNFIHDPIQQFQFLDLSKPSDVSADILNNYLKGKGTLGEQGQAFIDAGRTHGINDLYLVSHAILETGNGKSTLAQGVKYKGVTVYNMYGVGAYDSCPVECGAQKAFEEGWTTPYKAIVGGAGFIGNDFIKNGLNTLYKMRWNPAAMAANGAYGKQYATDIGWASKQLPSMYNLYQQIGSYKLYLDIPVYKQ